MKLEQENRSEKRHQKERIKPSSSLGHVSSEFSLSVSHSLFLNFHDFQRISARFVRIAAQLPFEFISESFYTKLSRFTHTPAQVNRTFSPVGKFPSIHAALFEISAALVNSRALAVWNFSRICARNFTNFANNNSVEKKKKRDSIRAINSLCIGVKCSIWNTHANTTAAWSWFAS